MSSLPRRLLSSSILVSAVLATLFWLPVWVFVLVVSWFALVSLYEFFTIVRHRGMLVHRPLSLTLGLVFLSLSAWRSLVEPGLVPTPILGPDTTVISWMWDIFWPATIVIIFVRQFTRENTYEALGGLATSLFGLAYIPALFGYLFNLRAMERGAWLVFFLILVTKMADAGAYVVGNLFGRHALIPRISPRKTVEGILGAIVFGAVTAALAAPVLQRPALTPGLALILGAFLGVVGQLGDLAESLLKRDCQVKDSGTLIPGLGGVLDVIDSLLFTAPLFYGVLIYG